MVNSASSELVAKRWAHALIDLMQENDSVSGDKVFADLKFVEETIESSEDLKNVVVDPSISTEEKQIVLCKLFQDKIESIVYNFLFVLNLRKRLNIIHEITECFKKELELINNIEHVEIVSAVEIDEDKKRNIESKLSSVLHKNLVADWAIDSDIIAGLVFNVNDTVIDNSVKHKLDELSKMIIKG